MLLQWTTEQQFEMHGSTYTDFFSIDISEKILKSCNSSKKKKDKPCSLEISEKLKDYVMNA